MEQATSAIEVRLETCETILFLFGLPFLPILADTDKKAQNKIGTSSITTDMTQQVSNLPNAVKIAFAVKQLYFGAFLDTYVETLLFQEPPVLNFEQFWVNDVYLLMSLETYLGEFSCFSL